MDRKPKLGEQVHFVLNRGPHAGHHRPAIITRVIDAVHVNLQVVTDGNRSEGDNLPNVFWKRNAVLDPSGETQASWHYPEIEL